MTTITPPPNTPAPVPQGQTVPLSVTVGGQAAVQLSSLALDSLINGLVKPSTTSGEIQLQTPQGLLSFKAPFHLPPNIQATFRLIQTQPVTQLLLVGLNGKTLPPNVNTSTLGNWIGTSGTTPQTAQSNMVTQTGSLPTAHAPIHNPATTLTLNTAQGMSAMVLSTTSPQNTPPLTGQNPPTSATPVNSPQNLLQTAQSPASSTQNTKTPTPQQTATPTLSRAIQLGNQLNVRLLNVQLPQQGSSDVSAPSSPGSNPGMTVQGTVTGQNRHGQVLVKLPQGQIALQTTAKMPPETQIKLEIISFEKPLTQVSAKGPGVTPILQPQVGANWPSLDDAIGVLKEHNPVLADHLQHQLIPKADHRLAANMIFFLKALGRGQFKNWADDQTLRALARAKPDILKRLDGDFEVLSSKAKTPNATDWKIAYVPMQGDNGLHQIRIAHRHPDDENPDGQDDPGVRFVIDLDLSRLGPMQLDGLAKEKQKKFDLIIRTKSALPGHMRHDIHEMFENGMQTISYDGKLLFQVTPNFVEIEGVDLTRKDLNLGMLV